MMHGPEKSDSVVVAVKPTNKAERSVAESVEPRTGTKGNAGQQSTRRAQDRESVSQALERVRQAARQRKKERFTSLLHHVDLAMLRTAFYAMKRDAAPGVDGMIWEAYEQDLDARLRTCTHVSKGGHTGRCRHGGGTFRRKTAQTTASLCLPGRQNRPASLGGGTQRDLRGGLPRAQVWISARAQSARRAGCAHRRDQQQEGELHTRCRYPVVLHGSFPTLGHPLPGAPGRRPAHPPARPEMVAGRRSRRRDRDDRGKRDGPAGDVAHWRQELDGTLPRAGVEAPPLPAGARPQCTREAGGRMSEQTIHTVGIIMNGVTGRMGLNQHLRRSIFAIMQQGGVKLSDSETIMPRAAAGGPQRRQAGGHLARSAAACRGPPISTRRWPIPTTPSTSTPRPPTAAPRPSARPSPPASTSTARSRWPTALETALELYRAGEAGRREARRGAGQALAARPAEAADADRELGFFGRILSVRGEFGYWVFEGDTVPAQRPSWNYRKEDGGGIILDMLCHWRYVLDNLFGAGEGRLLPGRHAHPARAGTKPASPTSAPPTIRPTPPSSWKAASSRTSTRPGACACAATTC